MSIVGRGVMSDGLGGSGLLYIQYYGTTVWRMASIWSHTTIIEKIL